MSDELPSDFNPADYLLINPDVAAAGLDPAEHYLSFGRNEGRIYKLNATKKSLLPSDFDPDVYLEINPDVAQAGYDPAYHYLTFGQSERRAYFRTTPIRSFPTIPRELSNLGFEHDTKNQNVAAPTIIAFYLPQFHRVKENDEWWGEGFTEWTNVKKAKPNIIGHKQPSVPSEKNYYDLSDIGVQIRQSILAKAYGIDAFCYYTYWFNGRRVLEKPLDMRIGRSDIDLKFCICWANENWTRRWDGRDNDILLQQIHSPESDREFIKDMIKYLADPSYLRINGRPILLVYRVDLIADCSRTADIWRSEVRNAGLGELHLCAVQAFGINDPRPFGFDAAVEFPPHGWFVESNLPATPYKIINPTFQGQVFDYRRAVDFGLRRPYPEFQWYRGAFPGWDNTPRRQDKPHFFVEDSPAEFERWLTGLLKEQILRYEAGQQIVFINAWNEWGEGAYLEPDEVNEFTKLRAIESARLSVLTAK